MTAAKKAAAKTASKSKSTTATATTHGAATDAVQLLTADHKDVRQLFRAYEKLLSAEADDEEKLTLATQICQLLTVHTSIEEEIFYPAARGALEDLDLLDEAEVEHASAKDLISQIQGMQPADDLYDAKVTVLGEYVEHHVKEEEGEMFPRLKKTELDLAALGEELLARKQELMSELGVEQDE